MIRLKVLLLAGGSLLAACTGEKTTTSTSAAPAAVPATSSEANSAPAAAMPTGFVTVDGQDFEIDGEEYQYVGVNFWYGAYLGAGGDIGNVERLRKELDDLKALGVTNLRVLGSSEDGPMKASIKPAFRNETDVYNEELLKGLDVLLAEMAKRDMKAVIYLNNFWEWSGGMGTYLSWVNDGEYVDLGDPDKPWPAYVLHTMKFYSNEEANRMFKDYIEAVVTRTNSVTGVRYVDDPTIMSWQLANEPRAGYNAEKPENHAMPAFYAWIEDIAGYIQSLDPNHLVSTGNEGFMGCADNDACFLEAHDTSAIDYLTFHMWPYNWGWLDDQDMEGTFDRVLANSGAYIDKHIGFANELGKPIVIEEFGLPRDGGALSVESTTDFRDRFYSYVYDRIEQSASTDGPLVGSNIWTWGGAGRAEHPDGNWQDGDRSYTGDPPQEPQGLNSVFDTDESTMALMKDHAIELGVQSAD
ncbi:glycoside hydrolase 5 family protein [Parvularcula sp. LCG005]|uniref:glycoside hydrolase 5 family protein n=1 Tax=Parvularcula sp. LCG005 TaxID=3078805 RepID=UPI002941CC7F|nr:cellulase family glycosylhydrolase [Parvularcula sp. LCG005]WOI53462.1 cellulase family glycosylhydrolase [Parvularcula sp. LCG005]